jgi:hypothetical protein
MLSDNDVNQMVIALAKELGVYDFEGAKELWEEEVEHDKEIGHEHEEEFTEEYYVNDILPEEYKITYKDVYGNQRVDVEIDGGEYSIFKSDEDAEQEAIDRLIDEPYFWKMAVEQDNTTDSLEDWARDVVSMDGAGHSLATYDGCTIDLNGGYVAFRLN